MLLSGNGAFFEEDNARLVLLRANAGALGCSKGTRSLRGWCIWLNSTSEPNDRSHSLKEMNYEHPNIRPAKCRWCGSELKQSHGRMSRNPLQYFPVVETDLGDVLLNSELDFCNEQSSMNNILQSVSKQSWLQEIGDFGVGFYALIQSGLLAVLPLFRPLL
jgi:hypothetical protein